VCVCVCGKYLELALAGLHLSALENLEIGGAKRTRERGSSQMLMKIL